MGGSCDKVSAWGQQSPVVSSMSCGDVVIYLCHTNGGIGNSCTIPAVKNCALYSSVDLKRHIITYTWAYAKLSENDKKAWGNIKICVYYLMYKLKQGSSIMLPVFRQVLGQRVLHTTQLNGHLKTIGV